LIFNYFFFYKIVGKNIKIVQFELVITKMEKNIYQNGFPKMKLYNNDTIFLSKD